MSPAIEVGVIADTHGLLRPEALEALHGCDLIIHAGDIGKPEILEALRRLAPLEAVRGNNDSDDWASTLPDSLDLRIGPLGVHVLHDLKTLRAPPPGTSVIIAGHSHKPLIERRDDLLLLNPGSAGPRRFRLPISLARLRIDARGAEARLVTLA